jgi:hypothetical protein
MNFLAPAFFAGLAALAIPVLLHLVNRERKEVVEFPSLMFLQRIPYKSVRRQKLRHLLLLALRCLAIAIVVAAFARPFFSHQARAAVAVGGAREVVVLVDRSYSMGYGDRWDRALAAVRRVAGGLGASDRATIVLFAHDAQVVTEPTGDRARIETALRTAKLTAEDTRYAPALKLAERILRGSNLPRKQLVMVSDFQKLGWSRPEEVSLPAGATMEIADVGDGETADVAVSRVTTSMLSVNGRPEATVAARLTNTGTSVRTVNATLELNGRAVESKRVSVPASGAAQVSFAQAAVPQGDSRGVVRIDEDALPQNDVFRFVLSPSQALSVLVLQPASPRANHTLYLTRALALGERPSFRVEVKSIAAATPRDLAGRSLVVLGDVAPPSGTFGARLREFVKAGGGLLVAAGTDQLQPAPEWKDLLPATLGPVVDRTGDAGGTLGWIDLSHPVFELFDAPRSGDLSSARFYRYRRLTAPGDTGVIARFDDGSPALVERQYGEGRVMEWASTLDTYWTDLPLQALWVPLTHELARHAGRYADARPWYDAGALLDLTRHAELTSHLGAGAAGGTPPVIAVETPSGDVQRLETAASRPVVALSEQGFYELRQAGAAKGTGRFVAVNVDPAEADLSRLDPRELVAAVTAGRGATVDAASFAGESKDERERRQTIWWYLLAGALVLLVGETVLSNRLSRVAS